MTQEKTVEEIIFELGEIEAVLSLQIYQDLTGKNAHFSDGFFLTNYNYFQARALKLGLQLPDLTEDQLSQPILGEQISKVQQYIALNKTESMKQLYHVGVAASLFFLTATKVVVGVKPEFIESRLQVLMKRVKELGVDIDDQLEVDLKDICDNYMNSKFDKDLEIIRVRLKKKVCGGLRTEISNPPPQPEPSSTVYKRSEVDPTRVITDECWTVSLVRLPDRSNSEHAFIVVEGKTGRKSKIWFADFVAVGWFGVVKPGTKEGKVRMDSYESVAVTTDQTSDRLLFKCQKRMMNVRAIDRLLFSTWLIAKPTAENLIKMIEAKQENPPKYHIMGNESLSAEGSALLSSNTTGHNCFTFAKMMLHDLNDPFIQLPEHSLDAWIGSATSRYLVDKQLRSQKWYKKPSFVLTLGFLAGIVVAYFTLKTFQPKI